MDEPIAAPVDYERNSYTVADLWPLEGDAFIVNLVRALRKREPLTIEMFSLSRTLEAEGKLATIAELARCPWRNALIVDLETSEASAELDSRQAELATLVRQFRSPVAGGWQLRNEYLEAKRNFARQWLRIKQQKDIWWVQSGQNIEAILAVESLPRSQMRIDASCDLPLKFAPRGVRVRP